MNRAWLAIGLLVGGCGGARERIVLVTIDTWRADALQQMPGTAAFAARGAVFEQAYSATSTTQPTHASLLTGLPPWQHGVTQNGEVLAETSVTLAERLKEAGFATGAVVASFPLGRRFGFAQGFDRYRDEFQVRYAQQWEGKEVEGGSFYSLSETVTDQALALLDELDASGSARQFLWVHYFDAHDPYGDAAAVAAPMPVSALLRAAQAQSPETGALVQRARELYTRDLVALDRALGRLFQRLGEERAVVTHVVLTADHGESFGEQGCIGHGKRLTPEQVHVPLVLVSPRVRPARRSDTAGSIDVAATLLALAGLERGEWRGRDLLAPPPAATLALGMRRNFAGGKAEQLLDGRLLAVDGARFYLARDGRLFTGDGAGVFLDDDAARAMGEEPLASELRAAFTRFQTLLEGTAVETLASEEVRDALKALGYGE